MLVKGARVMRDDSSSFSVGEKGEPELSEPDERS